MNHESMKWYQLTASKPMFDQLAQVQRNVASFTVLLPAALMSTNYMKAKKDFSEPIKILPRTRCPINSKT